MKQVWESEELIAYWTLVEDDWRLLGNKTGATRLGFALVLKYVEIEGEFPRYAEQIPPAAVEFVAELVKGHCCIEAKGVLSMAQRQQIMLPRPRAEL